jgi:6-phosphogluconolactonase
MSTGVRLRSSVDPTVAYIASARDREIMVFALRHGGQLELIQRVALDATPTPLAVSPDRRFLYVGLRGDPPGVATLAIAPANGLLHLLGRAELTDPPMYLATDATGGTLLVASYAGASYTLLRIAHDGTVSQPPIAHEGSTPRAHAIVTDPTNRYAFVTALGADAIVQRYFAERSGQSSANELPRVALPAGSGPRHAVFHPNGEMLYVNGELDGRVYALRLDASTGRLRIVESRSLLPRTLAHPAWAAEIAITPDGRHLYASDRHTSTLAHFELHSDGGLGRREIIETEAQPRSLAIDPRGRYLLAAGEISNHVSVYAIDAASGALRRLHRYRVGGKPVWIAIVDVPGGG